MTAHSTDLKMLRLDLPPAVHDSYAHACEIIVEPFNDHARDGTPPHLLNAEEPAKIVATIAQRILPEGRFDWSELRSHEALRQTIGRVVPGYEAASDIGVTKQEFVIAGRTFREPAFNTPTGRAAFRRSGAPAGARGTRPRPAERRARRPGTGGG